MLEIGAKAEIKSEVCTKGKTKKEGTERRRERQTAIVEQETLENTYFRERE